MIRRGRINVFKSRSVIVSVRLDPRGKKVLSDLVGNYSPSSHPHNLSDGPSVKVGTPCLI